MQHVIDRYEKAFRKTQDPVAASILVLSNEIRDAFNGTLTIALEVHDIKGDIPVTLSGDIGVNAELSGDVERVEEQDDDHREQTQEPRFVVEPQLEVIR